MPGPVINLFRGVLCAPGYSRSLNILAGARALLESIFLPSGIGLIFGFQGGRSMSTHRLVRRYGASGIKLQYQGSQSEYGLIAQENDQVMVMLTR